MSGDAAPFPDDFADAVTPFETPVLLGQRADVVIRGTLALTIRDAVRTLRRYYFCDLSHVGPHFHWNDAQWAAFHDWAPDVYPSFQRNAWVLTITRIAETTDLETHPCRIYGVLGAQLSGT